MPQQAAPKQKQQLNVYTLMLIMAFIALCTGCGFLYYELSQYGSYPQWKTGGSVGSLMIDSIHSAVPAARSFMVG